MCGRDGANLHGVRGESGGDTSPATDVDHDHGYRTGCGGRALAGNDGCRERGFPVTGYECGDRRDISFHDPDKRDDIGVFFRGVQVERCGYWRTYEDRRGVGRGREERGRGGGDGDFYPQGE